VFSVIEDVPKPAFTQLASNSWLILTTKPVLKLTTPVSNLKGIYALVKEIFYLKPRFYTPKSGFGHFLKKLYINKLIVKRGGDLL
jgi:hypothetical protein